jgi:dTDP-L-rhamnose 4-epimerase
MRILITGGAGFIGSHLTDHLLQHGYDVRVLDQASIPNRDVELIRGDICNRAIIQRALAGVDAVFHFAARVGVAQSMYDIAAYTATNNLGTAMLLEQLAERPVQRLIVASSLSVYGEGLYAAADGRCVEDVSRSLDQLRRSDWEPRDANGDELAPRPTPEWKRPHLKSVYALSKFDQERLALMVAQAYQMPAVALRFFNVYGSRQPVANPYSSVLVSFAARLLNGRAPLIFEDGRQQRDFVHVRDVVQACRLALEQPAERVVGRVFNVGSGEAARIDQVAQLLADTIGVAIEPELTGRYRPGDVRHCVADLTQARSGLGYAPSVRLAEGLAEFVNWIAGEASVQMTRGVAACAS